MWEVWSRVAEDSLLRRGDVEPAKRKAFRRHGRVSVCKFAAVVAPLFHHPGSASAETQERRGVLGRVGVQARRLTHLAALLRVQHPASRGDWGQEASDLARLVCCEAGSLPLCAHFVEAMAQRADSWVAVAFAARLVASRLAREAARLRSGIRADRRKALRVKLGTGKEVSRLAYKLVGKKASLPVLFARDADGSIVSQPLEVDRVLCEQWGQVYHGNAAGLNLQAALFAPKHEQHIFRSDTYEPPPAHWA